MCAANGSAAISSGTLPSTSGACGAVLQSLILASPAETAAAADVELPANKWLQVDCIEK